ncbi:MAG: hypothetical protein R3F55_22850 [Alphaproteobacteria bacterium]
MAYLNRHDPIPADRAFAALERLGAALVLQRLTEIAVPDSDLDMTDGKAALDIGSILPDWSGEQRSRLLSRPVFDPAGAGHVRLHNDNQGVVRSYLAALWLDRLIRAGCPMSAVRNLLFADIYGLHLVIPSLKGTAAWLSISQPDIANEVIDREPLLLMGAGDPASLSLTTRRRVLDSVIQRTLSGQEIGILDRDSLRRFSGSDLAECVRANWQRYADVPEVRELLLRVIWLGELTGCVDLAIDASFGTHEDRYTQVFAGRAIMAAAPNPEKVRYVQYLCQNAGSVAGVLVWDAVETLFPTQLTTNDLSAILTTINIRDRRDHMGIEYIGPELADRLSTIEEVESFLSCIRERLRQKLNPDDEPFPEDEPLMSTLEAGGRRLLELVPQTQVPIAATEAAIRLRESRRYRRPARARDEAEDLFSLLTATAERRRMALWQATDRLNGAAQLNGKSITEVWQVEHFGFPLQLRAEDLKWLEQDIVERPTAAERQIAVNAAMRLWKQGGEEPEILTRIRAAGTTHPDTKKVIDEWLTREPSDRELEYERRRRQRERRDEARAAQLHRSWLDFAAKLRADPKQFRSLLPLSEGGIDSRLYHLWAFLHGLGENRNTFAISDLSPIEQMFGSNVASELRSAFVSYWRQVQPTLRNERPEEERNKTRELDCIAIVGVTLEASHDPEWAANLTPDDATKAAILATLELNGYPSWFPTLARVQPDAVRGVLERAVAPELATGSEDGRCRELEDISRADRSIGCLLVNYLFEYLTDHDSLPTSVLRPALAILVSYTRDSGALASLLEQRFDQAHEIEGAATCLSSLFQLDPGGAIASLDRKLKALSQSEQTLLVLETLPELFGGQWADNAIMRADQLQFDTLERLVIIAFRTVRVEEDVDHADGEVYSPGAREHAEDARGRLFKALFETPGAATFAAINRLAENPDIPIRRERLSQIARERAEKDAEYASWTSGEVYAFEHDFTTTPRNAFDLQRLISNKIADWQHSLIHSDFAQGSTLALLPKEVDVQNWLADRFRSEQGRGYSVEREPHVADEKEPDIRFRATATDASLALEVKVAECWSLSQLEDALRAQLVGRYLRDREHRHGILLIVHKKRRSRGWEGPEGGWLRFEQVVSHLADMARSISSEGRVHPSQSLR